LGGGGFWVEESFNHSYQANPKQDPRQELQPQEEEAEGWGLGHSSNQIMYEYQSPNASQLTQQVKLPEIVTRI